MIANMPGFTADGLPVIGMSIWRKSSGYATNSWVQKASHARSDYAQLGVQLLDVKYSYTLMILQSSFFFLPVSWWHGLPWRLRRDKARESARAATPFHWGSLLTCLARRKVASHHWHRRFYWTMHQRQHNMDFLQGDCVLEEGRQYTADETLFGDNLLMYLYFFGFIFLSIIKHLFLVDKVD